MGAMAVQSERADAARSISGKARSLTPVTPAVMARASKVTAAGREKARSRYQTTAPARAGTSQIPWKGGTADRETPAASAAGRMAVMGPINTRSAAVAIRTQRLAFANAMP